jgi:hypothetical protein
MAVSAKADVLLKVHKRYLTMPISGYKKDKRFLAIFQTTSI